MSKQNKIIKTLLTIVILSTSLTAHADWFSSKQTIESTDKGLGSRIKENLVSNANPCYSSLCLTMAGLVNCLLTNEDYATWEAGQFFKKNTDGTYMQRVSNVVVSTSTNVANGSQDTFLKPITVPVIVNVISPSAYTAFVKVARANPNCMETFCKNNCLLLAKLDPDVIKNKIKEMDGRTSIVIGGVVYKAGARPAQPASNMGPAQPAIPAIDNWSNLDSGDKFNLAQSLLLELANNNTNLRCLSETDGGVKLRMFCSQCVQNLNKADQALLSKTCTSFDSSRNVGYGMEVTELSQEYQQQLATAKLTQAMAIQQQALDAAGNGSTAAVPSVNFTQLASQFSTGLPNFSLNPGGTSSFGTAV